MLRRVFCLAAFASLAVPSAVAWAGDDDDDDDDDDRGRHHREKARREAHHAYCRELEERRHDVYSDYENTDDPELRKEVKLRLDELDEEIFHHCADD